MTFQEYLRDPEGAHEALVERFATVMEAAINHLNGCPGSGGEVAGAASPTESTETETP